MTRSVLPALSWALVLCFSIVGLHAATTTEPAPEVIHADVVVYGGTPCGVMAAVAAARHGRTVALIDVNNHLGGVVSAGLDDTDIGSRHTVGGLANEFLTRISNYYRTTYGPASKQFLACKDGLKYEPHVAQNTFEQMVKEQAKITVYRRRRIDLVTLTAGRLATLVADDMATGGRDVFAGQEFIDASYEGDLMAAAGVPCRVGRESRSEYGEYLAGINVGPKSVRGAGDQRTMAYNYRVCITDDKNNAVPFPKPENFDPAPWRASYGVRIEKHEIQHFADLYVNAAYKVGPNGKFDTNWCDLPRGSDGYAEGDWTERHRIEARHRDYFLSLLYYLQNDPALPAAFHADAANWGLPKDEFVDNGHFPFQIYVREARRMLGRYVLAESDITHNRYKPDGICEGSYAVDCHTVSRILSNGRWVGEATRHVGIFPYDIPYACITPYEPGDLLVPLCLSATHVANCSVRMEPVYMMLGQAAGVAADLAIDAKSSVQQVDVKQLRATLLKDGAVLDGAYVPQVKIAWAPAHPKPGEAVHFQIEHGTLKDPLVDCWWDFAGDGEVGAQGETPTHVFALDKTYSVSLIVRDKAGRIWMAQAPVAIGTGAAQDVTMDDFDADLFGKWEGTYPHISYGQGLWCPDAFIGPGIHRDDTRLGKKGPARAHFEAILPHAGRYEVCLGFRPERDQATNVPVVIHYLHGVKTLTVNQRKGSTPFPFLSLGEYRFAAGDAGYVAITNHDTDGRVAIDSVRWVWVGE